MSDPDFVFLDFEKRKDGKAPPESGIPTEKPPDSDFQNQDNPPGIPTEKPIGRAADATTLFNLCREFWNGRGMKPECREIMIRPLDQAEILSVFRSYSFDEIKNAIGNYGWHLQAGPGYRPPAPYGSLAGFLKTGVARYFDDGALDRQFKIGEARNA